MLALGLLKEFGPMSEKYGEVDLDCLMVVIFNKGFMNGLVLREHTVSVLMYHNKISTGDK